MRAFSSAYEAAMAAPRRFKTAFIFFSSARHKEIKEELAQEGKTEKVRWILFLCVAFVASVFS